MTPEFHPEAQKELAEAVKTGFERSPELGRELLAEVRRVVSILCEMPQLGARLDTQHRRFPLTRFPFGIIFRVDGDLLRVVAIAHRRHRPGYWSLRA
jgi:hypothetical protein